MSQSTTLVTLHETIILLLPEHEWIQKSVCDLLQTRWSFVRSKYISENGCIPPVKRMSDDKMHSALPLDIAYDSVAKWIPWALHMLREDLNEVCDIGGDFTPENITVGAKAGEEFVM